MERDIQLAKKAAELIEMLQPWATEVLGPSEQLLVSLRIQEIPMIARDPDDAEQPALLGMKLRDFFTEERLAKHPGFRSVAIRTHNCLRREYWGIHGSNPDITLGQFLGDVTEASLLRIPNFGQFSLRLIKTVLKESELSLKRC